MSPGAGLLLAAGIVLVLLALWTAWTLTRIQRLERRVDRAWTALDTQLRRRAALAETLARYSPGALGEGAARLAAAAGGVRSPAAGDRELAENALGRELRTLPLAGPGVPADLATDLWGTASRVALARQFYNDAVRDTRALRRRRLPRMLGLHARRPLPRFFDIDDALDEAGARPDGAGQAAPAVAVPWTVGTAPPERSSPRSRSRGSNP